MLTLAEKIIFTGIVLVTVGAFALPVVQRIRIMAAGRPERRWIAPWTQITGALTKVFFQRCTLRQERIATGVIHFFIFYSALSFDTMTLNHTLEGFFPGFFLFGSSPLGLAFSALIDAAAVLVLVGVAFLAFRRFVIRPKAYATTRGDSAIIYIALILVTLSYVYFEVLSIAEGHQPPRWSFIGTALSGLVQGSEISAAQIKLAWWVHILLVYGFIIYVPHSKYFHMFAGPANVLFGERRSGRRLRPLDIENSEVFGLEKAPDLTWKDSLDTFACMECGRCQDACPAFASDKPLSPKMVLFNLERHLLAGRKAIIAKDREALGPLCPDVHSPDEIWSCTTCGACQHVCPVEIEHIRKIVGVRQSEVLTHSRFPQELSAFFRNVETNSNPWGIGFSKRGEWAEGLDVPLIADRPGAEYLFWVGCAGSYDEEGKKSSRALASVLKAAGVDFAVLGPEEKCCGDSARRLGNEYLFQSLAAETMGLLARRKVKKIITLCPHGYNTLKNEYPVLAETLTSLPEEGRAWIKSIRVYHYVEVLDELLAQGRLPLNRLQASGLTFHDSCYLGRHNGLVNEPRRILQRIAGDGLLELGRNKEHSFCCGAGGGLMWTEEKLGRRINHLRAEEVIRSGAGAVVTSCPFCTTMLRDGLKDKTRPDIQVKDLAQMVAEATSGKN